MNPINIIMTTGGLLVCFFVGKWYTKVNTEQEEARKERNKAFLESKEHEMNQKRADSEIKEMEKQSRQIHLDMQKEAQTMQVDLKHLTGKIIQLAEQNIKHNMRITATEKNQEKTDAKVDKIAEQNVFIADYFRELKSKEDKKK